MSISILAVVAESVADSIPWWWKEIKEIIQPVSIGIASALLTWFLGYLTIHRTEWYRRLSRWETYGRELWLHQVKVLSEALQIARHAMIAANNKTWNSCEGDPARNKPLSQAFWQNKNELDYQTIQVELFLGSSFNKVWRDFAHQVFVFGTASNTKPSTHDECERMLTLYTDLLRCGRESLGVEVLANKTIDVIKQEINEVPKKQEVACE